MEKWPLSLKEIAVLSGQPAALALSRKFGGTRVYIPACPKRNSIAVRRLVEVIGELALPGLCFAYPGVWLYIPNLERRTGIRTVSVETLAATGSASAIARIHGVSELSVRRARRALRHDPNLIA